MYVINIVSNEGHTEVELSTPQAVADRISTEVKENGKWAYVNSRSVDIDTFDPTGLKEEDTITLTNPLVGG